MKSNVETLSSFGGVSTMNATRRALERHILSFDDRFHRHAQQV